MWMRTMVLLAMTAVPAAAQQVVQLPARDVALAGEPTGVFTVGKLEGAEWEMFSNVRSVAFDRADNLYVLDGQNVRVLVFDRDGRFVRQFGRRGGGPGELQAPLSMTILANDEVVINDLGNRAFITFTGTGEFVRSVPHPAGTGMPLGSVHAHPLGILARANPTPMMRAEGGRDVATLFVQPMVRDAAPITLLEMPVPPPQQLDVSGGADNRRVAAISMDPVFGPRTSFATLADGTVIVQNDSRYTVRLLDRNGRPLRTLQRAGEPRRVTKQDQDAWQERRRNGEGPAMQSVSVMTTTGGGGAGGGTSVRFGGGGGSGGGSAPPPGEMRMNLDNIPFAEHMAIVTGLRADPQGRIWIQRRHDDATDAGPIDIITAEGRYIGTLPPQAMPGAVSASGLAAYVVRDDLDVERVAVRRLPAGWR